MVTRFPPEPNGYLHIGHAKSICLNFGIAEEFGGRCHLRFDDTNPTKEEQEYIDAIERDVRWLGFDWGKHLYHASDYFEQLYDWAEHLISAGKAYVDDQSPGGDAASARGTLTEPARTARSATAASTKISTCSAACGPANFRTARACCAPRSTWRRATSTCAIRCSTASCMRTHPRTGTAWWIYPSYDFAHGQSDAIEGITHSICTLEFEDHRPLYDWFLDNLPVPSQPRQYEFARLNLTYTVLSKRVLTELVRDGHVNGWDDPRMPTLAGLRRRGVPPEAIRDFVKRIGVAKANSVVDVGDARLLDPRGAEQDRAAPHGGAAAAQGRDRELSGRAERGARRRQPSRRSGARARARSRSAASSTSSSDDFMENPPKKFFRLSPGKRSAAALRLFHHLPRGGEERGRRGRRTALHLRSGDQGRQRAGRPQGQGDDALGVGGATPCRPRSGSTIRCSPSPTRTPANFAADLNPQSLEVLTDARVEPALAQPTTRRAGAVRAAGLFRAATRTPRPASLVFNRTVGLRDTFAKEVGGKSLTVAKHDPGRIVLRQA